MSTPYIRLDHLYADLDKSMSQLRQQHQPVQQSRKIVEAALLDGEAHYGINTGFGVLANRFMLFSATASHNEVGRCRLNCS